MIEPITLDSFKRPYRRGRGHKKSLADYIAEAVIVNDCLVHPSAKARIVYKMRYGDILTKDQYVCHRCDEPYCILDDHHFIGSCKDNIVDSVLKGRHY